MLKTPGDAAAHLLGHRHQVAMGFQHVVEIERDEMRTAPDQHLRREGVVARKARTPGAAVHEDADRRVRRPCRINVQAFDGRLAVGEAPGSTQPAAHQLARVREPREDLVAIRRVHRLVVRRVECLLVVV